MTLDAEVDRSPQKSSYDWHDVRFIGAVPGRYAMPERREGDGKPPVYACRLCSISTQIAVIVGPVIGKHKEMLTAHFDEFGIVKGRICRQLKSGFVLQLNLNPVEREKLGGKIVWQKKRVIEQIPDKREHKRVTPRDPRSMITMGDGTKVPCFVIDISQSGVAVSAPVSPEIGTPMAVGRLVGRVVRNLDVGFAVQFMQVQALEELDTLIAPLPD